VFERYRIPTYIQAGFKPYIIAAAMLTSRFEDPVKMLRAMKRRASKRMVYNEIGERLRFVFFVRIIDDSLKSRHSGEPAIKNFPWQAPDQ